MRLDGSLRLLTEGSLEIEDELIHAGSTGK